MLFSSFLAEKSSIVDYYEKHPELIKDIDFTISRKAEDVDILQKVRLLLVSSQIEGRSYNKLKINIEKFYADIKTKLNDIVEDLKSKGLYPRWASFITPNGDDLKFMIDVLTKNNMPVPPFLNRFYVMKKTFDEYEVMWLTKFAKERGVSYNFLFKSLQEIFRYRSMSGQKLSKEALEAIKILTVKNSPGKIYRGWFLDGDKISKIKNIENLKEGDTFTFNFGKATSWSTVRDIAASFTYAQDMVKNKEDGYAMVISYEPSVDEVVADFRDIKLSDITKFYNQQEIMLDTGKKTFKIESIEKNGHIAQSKVNGNGGTSSGSYNDMVKNIVTSEKMKKVDDDSIMKLAEEMSKMTVGEVYKKYPNNIASNFYPDYIEDNKNINYRLFLILNDKWADGVKYLKFDGNEVTVFITKVFSSSYDYDKMSYVKIKITNDYKQLFSRIKYTLIDYKSNGELEMNELIEVLAKWFK